jgi:NAD(P)-dependent dehydrogenase (short-subunit alcohol dehydrogenase family)
VVLVTGGTSGIGRATAIAFGAAGAKVVCSGRREAEGKATAALIHNAGAECLFVHAKQGIRINAVNPGITATEMFDRLTKETGSTADSLASTVPMDRTGQAEEIVQAVVFLCSDAASYITGHPLVIDGGYTTN